MSVSPQTLAGSSPRITVHRLVPSNSAWPRVDYDDGVKLHWQQAQTGLSSRSLRSPDDGAGSNDMASTSLSATPLEASANPIRRS